MTAQVIPFARLRTTVSVYGTRVTEELLHGSEVDDGGRWALYCHHDDGEVGVLQDTNRRRLWAWARHSDDWCPYCQEIRDGYQESRRLHPSNYGRNA